MLCESCENIVLDVSLGHSEGADHEIETEIRTYASIYSLKDCSASCDFCSLIYEEAQSLETEHQGPYCKEKWGVELTKYLLAHSPISVCHISTTGRQNVAINCLLDAQNAPGYVEGPLGYQYKAILGGIHVKAGMEAGPVDVLYSADDVSQTRNLRI